MTKDEIDDVLFSWKTLNKAIGKMSEEDVKAALNREMVCSKRVTTAVRLHQRYTILRAARERDELVAALSDVPAFLGGAK